MRASPQDLQQKPGLVIEFTDYCTVCQRKVPEQDLHYEYGRLVCNRAGCTDFDAPEKGGS